jgi:hypothetical protein
VFDAKLVEFELTLSDPVHEFDAGDGRRGSSKMLEAEHRTKPQLDRSMVLFNQIVDVFGRPDLALISLGMFAESLCRPAMRRLIAVERDLVWQLALALERPSEERLGGGDVPLGAKQEIDGVSLFVDSAVKIRPAASDFDVGLIDAPGPPSWASEAVPALLELRHIAPDPAHDRRMRQGEPAFGHHLGEISKAELVSQIPAHAEHDDLLVKVPALVVSGQAVSGGGELWSPYWTGPAPMTLVTLSTTDVHDLGGGSLSYRFGGGTDLIGDTTAPIDGSGLVFTVNTNPNLDVGFNLWSNNNGSYTGFIAGNSPAAGQPIIYLGETGALTAVPEASTWVMMLTGFGGLGFAAFYRSRRSSVSALA